MPECIRFFLAMYNIHINACYSTRTGGIQILELKLCSHRGRELSYSLTALSLHNHEVTSWLLWQIALPFAHVLPVATAIGASLASQWSQWWRFLLHSSWKSADCSTFDCGQKQEVSSLVLQAAREETAGILISSKVQHCALQPISKEIKRRVMEESTCSHACLNITSKTCLCFASKMKQSNRNTNEGHLEDVQEDFGHVHQCMQCCNTCSSTVIQTTVLTFNTVKIPQPGYWLGASPLLDYPL